MNLQVFDRYEDMSLAAAAFMHRCIMNKPDLLVCPASGNSPRRAYHELAARMNETRLRHAMRVAGLDEWVGISHDDPSGSGYQLRSQLIGPLGIRDYFLFDGKYADEEAELRRAGDYLEKNGPIDLCVLGIGTNGHLGLNEPGECLNASIHKARLAESTRAHPMMAGASFRPEYGITLGMKDILSAGKILLLVSGASKKAVLADFMTRKIRTQLPASFLWLHPDVTYMFDKEAMPA